MQALNINQIENATTFRDPLPAEDTITRLEKLIERRKIWLAIIGDTSKALNLLEEKLSVTDLEASTYRIKLINRRTDAALRVTDLTAEMVEVATMLVAEKGSDE